MRSALVVVAFVVVVGLVLLARRGQAPSARSAVQEGRLEALPPARDPGSRLAVPLPEGNGGGHGAASARVATGADPDAGPDAPPAEIVEPPAPGGLLVRVVDALGTPAAGIVVELRMHVGGQGEDDRGRATTDAAQGLARIDLGDLDELRERAGELGLGLSFSVAAEIASATPVRKALDGWPEAGQRVELTLPPTATVRVRVRTRDGAALAGEARIGCWWVPADVAAADPACAYERVPEHLFETRAGVASIEHVGLGLALQLTGSAPGLGHVSVRGIAGPREAGEVREVELRLGPPLATLRLRVLDGAGRPLGNASLRGELWHDPDGVPEPNAGPPRPGWLVLASDAAGLVTFTHAPGTSASAARLDLVLRASDVDAARDEHWSLASLFLPRSLGEGESVDLGDVRLAPVPVIAEGRVIDGAGNPVSGAALRFMERFGAGPEHPWFNLREGRCTTLADGHFRLRGALPRALAVEVTARGFAPHRSEDLEIGARGLELVLAPEAAAPARGSVKVHVVLEPEVYPLALLLELEARQGGGRSPDWMPGQVMEIGGLAPGSYDVWVETREGELELARVAGVEVVAGQATEDPRLLPLDLRGLARTVRLEAVRPDGTPWRRRALLIDPLEPGTTIHAETDDEGRATLVLPRRITRLEVGLDRGHASPVILGARGEPVRVALVGE